MLPKQSSIRLSEVVFLLLLIIKIKADQFSNDNPVRYLSGGSSPLAKGGWRPVVTSDTITAHFANVLGGQTVGQKFITGPALIETKVISPHILNLGTFGSEIIGNGILSTSTRPLVTRDVNKFTTLAQAYKNSMYPQNINLNAPVNTYINPFSIPTGPGISTYKLNPGYQYENAYYIKHQQPIMTHRPVTYNKHQGQMMVGKRLKPNHMIQQFSSNNFQQPIQMYHNNPKKPSETYQRPLESYHKPIENYSKPHELHQRPVESYKKPVENYSKPNQNNYQKPVNPHESLQAQTKNKHHLVQNVAAVTYKPPFNPHFQQFGIKEEEPFGPIPSSILGSFSSFGHASVKAREPTYVKSNHTIQTTTPLTTTEAFSPVSPTATIQKRPTQELQNNTSTKFNNVRNVNDDYTKHLSPPPHQVAAFSQNKSKDFKPKIKGNFIPSPPDPLNKNLNAPEILKPIVTKEKQSNKLTYNTNLPTKRPEISSFFDTTAPVSTIDPFDAQSTHSVPENLLVQMPPPYATSTFSGKFNSVKENYQIHHGKTPVKYSIFEDHKYFPSTRGQDLFGSKYVKNNQEVNTKLPHKGSYEVTENWGSSGEFNTQPTLHSWISGPAQSYKQYNKGLKQPTPQTVNIVPNHDSRIIPISFSPPPPPKGPEGTISYTTIPSVYSTIQSNHDSFFTDLENSLSSLTDIQKNQPSGEESYDLASPVNATYVPEEINISSTTPTYEDIVTTQRNQRRKPLRNKYYETTVSPVTEDFKEFTTKYEVYKEEEIETENEVQLNDLPTLPPNRHFKRPVTTTPVPIETWEEKLRKKNKNRRRRPVRVQYTTEESVQETSTYTDHPIRSNRYRTTTVPEVETVTRPVRQRVRLPYRSRLTTKPTSQPELTSSAQPTIVPTSPVTTRSKLHSRIRLTTSVPFDLDDLTETTTPRSNRIYESNDKQSSIMKIAKDNHSNRLPPVKVRPYENIDTRPDYTHKQDEKDTPTSDVSVNTYGPKSTKYSAQKLKNEVHNDNSKELSELSDIVVEHTPEYFVDPENSIDNKNAQLLTEQKLGNRGSIKSNNKDESLETIDVEQTGESAVITTTPLSSNKNQRIKIKPSKYDTNRPRFSVKDYRNRLNQLTSTSTDKPNQVSEATVNTKLRFPNRSRFPSFKDQDNGLLGSEVSTSTEVPRKKFTPKDPRHKGVSNDEHVEDEDKKESTPNKSQNEHENEIVAKLVPKNRGAIRPNRNRSTTTSTASTTTVESTSDVSEKPLKVNNAYTNVKRPVLRKRIHKNDTIEVSTENSVVETVSTSTETVLTTEAKVESSTGKFTSETAIMKIAKEDKKNVKSEERIDNSSSEISQRVSDLTLASGKEYNTPGLFKSVSPNTRKVPNYFTIATDDPILPIEAFFPQLSQKKES